MALTMTRTRTQTALNKLAGSLAEVNGELAFLAGIQPRRKDRRAAAAARREELLRLREALFTVIRRYDPELNPEDIGATYDWMRGYGRKATARTVGRYFAALQEHDEREALAHLAAVPTRLLVGSEDRLTSVRGTWELSAGIRGSRMTVLPGRGHMLTYEAPDAVADAVGESLGS